MSTELQSSGTSGNHRENCIFCRIASGGLPSHVVYEDDRVKAFLDIHPIRPAHVLIIPKAHYDYYDDLPPDLAAAIVHLGQGLGKAMKSLYGVERAAFLFTGTDVAHVHAHVLPMHAKADITSVAYIEQRDLTFRLPPRADDDELRRLAALVGSRLGDAGAGQ